MSAKTLPLRSQVKESDKWNLKVLFKNDAEWEKAFAKWTKRIDGFKKFKGKLGSSPKTLAAAFQYESDFDRAGEPIGQYPGLQAAGDAGNAHYQRMVGRFRHVATQSAQAQSFMRPEIMAIDSARMKKFLASPELKKWKLRLDRMLRYRAHTLGDEAENVMSLQGPMSGEASAVFGQLLTLDMKFGDIKDDKNKTIELNHSSYTTLLHASNRNVRKSAFDQYYGKFDELQHTIAATLAGAVHRNVYNAKARKYKSALEASLFHDNVPVKVYDNLIATIRKHLPTVHRYFEVRRKIMKLSDIHHYDTYAPIIPDVKNHHTWDQAVDVVVDAMSPLGDEYCTVMRDGLTRARWCDRYPNKGKGSGAFSSGTYDGPPYIQMNFQPEVIEHVFTLTHEAGHSMHHHYAAKTQPYPYYDATIFTAEVASTFNEQLLAQHMLKRAKTNEQRAYLINRRIDGIRGTIIRQTMFAEFEKNIHALAESGEPLTVEKLRETYRALLDAYFGPKFTIDEKLSLECLRIPHFHGAFYVYKYATGLSAAIALAHRVTNGSNGEVTDYLNFLKGGGSKFPLDLLRDAGVDMSKPAPIDSAMKYFGSLVDELESL